MPLPALVHRLQHTLAKYRLGYRPTDLVLDVGSGNRPHPRADLLCDLLVADDGERGGALVVDRPLVGGALERLPFKDGAFGYAHAAHILEHVADPLAAVRELTRVARAGYVETPAEFGGKLLDMPFHRWYVRQEGQGLVFTGKDRGMHDDHLCEKAYGLWHHDGQFRSFFWRHLDLFLVRVEWEGQLEARLEGPTEPLRWQAEEAGVAEASSKDEEGGWAARSRRLMRDYYRSGWYGPKRAVDLQAICQCPACGGGLAFGEPAIACQNPACGRSYGWLRPEAGLAVPMLILPEGA